MQRITRRLTCRGAAVLMMLTGLAACEDGPTAPGVYTQEAEGSVWAAVVVPRSTPDLRTWLPYIRPRDPSSESALRRIRDLRAEADALRRQGELERALGVEEAAARLAAGSVTEAVPASVLIASLGALDIWLDRAAEARLHGEFRDLEGEARQVRRLRRSAYDALQAGDTASALRGLAEAAARVRASAPDAVAAQALARAEARLALAPASDLDAARALRLIRNSREALAAGDGARALRRALYALQLAEQRSAEVSADDGGS